MLCTECISYLFQSNVKIQLAETLETVRYYWCARVCLYGISLYSNCLFLYFLCILTVNYFVRFSISARGTRCPQIEAWNPKGEMSKNCLF